MWLLRAHKHGLQIQVGMDLNLLERLNAKTKVNRLVVLSDQQHKFMAQFQYRLLSL